jgi:SAM-dependent methyltransferase
MMNDYDGIASFYDVEHAPFTDDVDMYRNFAESSGGSLLELASGSGRLLLPLAQDGYTLVGVDSSAPMLAIARQHLTAAGVLAHCELMQADIRTMRLERTFRMVFLALGSFAHLTQRSDQQQTLATARLHLSRGGLFLLDISNADIRYMESLGGQLLHQGTWRRDDGSMLTHFVSPATATDRRLLELTHFYDVYTQGGTIQRTTATMHLALFERGEVELLLEQAGFTIKDVYGTYDLEPYQVDSPRMIFVAEAR